MTFVYVWLNPVINWINLGLGSVKKSKKKKFRDKMLVLEITYIYVAWSIFGKGQQAWSLYWLVSWGTEWKHLKFNVTLRKPSDRHRYLNNCIMNKHDQECIDIVNPALVLVWGWNNLKTNTHSLAFSRTEFTLSSNFLAGSWKMIIMRNIL